jgi:hypothetical protein
MEDYSQDFDVLAERADDCGALWAARTLRRAMSTRIEPAPEWQGSFDEARRLVDTFAPRLSFNDRERLAALVQYSAEWTWADSLEVAPQIAFARTG